MEPIRPIESDRTVPRVELTRLTPLEREEERQRRERERRRRQAAPNARPAAADDGPSGIDIRV